METIGAATVMLTVAEPVQPVPTFVAGHRIGGGCRHVEAVGPCRVESFRKVEGVQV